MSFITRLPLLGRRCAFPFPPVPLPLSFKRDASRLSAIHDGLRRSDRTRPQGPKEIRQRPGEDEYLSPEERRRQRALARQNPITYKIRKGKKDITQEPGPSRKSKAARFADPRDPYGKHSLVKKFKTGELFKEFEGQGQVKKDGHLQHDDFVRQMMSGDSGDHSNSRKKESSNRYSDAPRGGRSRPVAWGERDRTDRRAPSEEFSRAPAWGGERARPDRRAPSEGPNRSSAWGGERDRAPRREPSGGDGRDRFDRGARVSPRSYDSPDYRDSRSQSSRSSYRPERTRLNESSSDRSYRSDRPDRPYRSDRPDRPNDADEADGAWVKKPKRQEGPVSIPYSSAASQFLYGTSTVEAALAASRRKLYKLYIYKGKDRRSKSLDKDNFIAELARKRGIPVEHVDETALPMLNKMSGSRPHNGHILEASPLSQMPIKALGEFSEGEGVDGPGFRVVPGHQSLEEVEVNGTSEFVPVDPSPRKPLVLIVDEVLDPGNLGAILRTASFMGVTAVAVSKRGSAPVTPVVLKASAGAAETLPIFSIESVVDFLTDSRENGWMVYAAVPPQGSSPRRQVDTLDVEKMDPLLKDPCIILVGNEGEGLSRALRRAADIEISIPNLSGSRVVDSLNVSVATGLLCSAFLKSKAKEFGTDNILKVQDAGAIF